MDGRCRNCEKGKNIERMKRVQYPSVNEMGVQLYGGFTYYYYCDDKCLTMFQTK